MDPVSAGLMVGGLALQAYGGFSAAGHAEEAARLNQAIAQDEMAINNQKRLQMELNGRRQQLEVYRNSQRLRAQATAAAVNQGATKGSGLQGGLAQITDAEGYNLLGINQNLEIGRNIFGINDSISQKKQALASVQSEMATDQAWASLGGSMIKMGPTIGGLSQDAYAWGKRNIGFNPGGPYV